MVLGYYGIMVLWYYGIMVLGLQMISHARPLGGVGGFTRLNFTLSIGLGVFPKRRGAFPKRRVFSEAQRCFSKRVGQTPYQSADWNL